eukprot:scaffold72479_cov49-Attheya_sp.AAC.5
MGHWTQSCRKDGPMTTQLGVRTTDNPRQNRRFWTNDRNLRYQRIGVDMYTDTLFADEKSKRGNKAAHKSMGLALAGHELMA